MIYKINVYNIVKCCCPCCSLCIEGLLEFIKWIVKLPYRVVRWVFGKRDEEEEQEKDVEVGETKGEEKKLKEDKTGDYKATDSDKK